MSIQSGFRLFSNFTDQIKTQGDRADLRRLWLKTSVENILSAEPEECLDYRKMNVRKYFSKVVMAITIAPDSYFV